MQDAFAQSIASGKQQTTLTAMFGIAEHEGCFVQNVKTTTIYRVSSSPVLHALKSEIIPGTILQQS
jgi:methylphosphotriester-DNA--protein-cysteine methyltransferase